MEHRLPLDWQEASMGTEHTPVSLHIDQVKFRASHVDMNEP